MPASGRDTGFPGGAGLVAGDAGWVLAEENANRALGPTLAWAGRNSVSRLHLLAPPGPAGNLARRSLQFSDPPEVWQLESGQIFSARPASHAFEPTMPQELSSWAQVINRSGAVAVWDGGVLRAEVLGLEVGRVVHHGGAARLEVGVGQHDRRAHQMVHADQPAAQLLASVAADVAAKRTGGIPAHPANQLAPERWLRALILRHPELAGARQLAPYSYGAPNPSGGGARAEPALALGHDADGQAVLVAASTGIDPDLVPAAADGRRAAEQEHPELLRLVLLVPAPDDHALTRRLAAALSRPAEARTVDAQWRNIPGG